MEALGLVAVIALSCWLVSATLGWLIEGAIPRLVRPLTAWWESCRVARRPRPGPAETLLLELELARIAACLQHEYLSEQPAKAERIRCWTLAYDRVLIELCESCSMPPPRSVPPLSAAERFTVEHALVRSGHTW